MTPSHARARAAVAPLAIVLLGALAPPGAPALTLEDALARATEGSPALAACRHERAAREAEASQAGRRANPELAVDLENFAGSGAVAGLDEAETTISLSQLVELGGKRARRVAAANLARDVAVWDCEVRRLDVMTATATAFVEVVAAQHRTLLADTLVVVAEEVLASVQRRVEAGGVSPVEERRARVSLELARVERERTARALTVARATLAAAWGDASPSFDRVEGDLEGIAFLDVPELDGLLARVDASPELARWATELGRREAERAAARADGTPDLAIGGGVRRFHGPGETALTVGVSLPLPFLDRNRDAAHAADRRVDAAREERRDASVRLRRDLGALHAALVDAHDEAAALRKLILPEADAALAESREAYRRGRLRLTDVLDAQRSAFELRGRYVDALAAANALSAEVERLLGAPLFDEPNGGPR